MFILVKFFAFGQVFVCLCVCICFARISCCTSFRFFIQQKKKKNIMHMDLSILTAVCVCLFFFGRYLIRTILLQQTQRKIYWCFRLFLFNRIVSTPIIFVGWYCFCYCALSPMFFRANIFIGY